MFRSSRTVLVRGTLIAAVLAIAPLASACEASADAPTQQWHQPTDGSSAAAGSMLISNAFVLGAPPAGSLAPGESAGLFFGLVNNGTTADTLVAISAPGYAGSVQLPNGPITVPGGGSSLPVGPKPVAVLVGLTTALRGGAVINQLDMTFRNAGTVRLGVPVMPRAQYYATFSLPAASPSATASPAPGQHTSASPRASGSASPSPSASH